PPRLETSPLSLLDALPISRRVSLPALRKVCSVRQALQMFRQAISKLPSQDPAWPRLVHLRPLVQRLSLSPKPGLPTRRPRQPSRSEEHTSELQSRENLVCR